MAKGSIGRKHKRGTANSRHQRIGAGGLGPSYGKGSTQATNESAVQEMQSNDNSMVSFILNVNDDYKMPRFYSLGHTHVPCSQ
jgi:hypothetical protein